MLRCRALVCLLVFCLPLLFTPSAFAQIDTGVIVGRVTDDSGAVLPGVTVVATQDGTGVASTTVSNERGEYIFPGLRVGATPSRGTARLQSAVQRNVRVNVQSRAQVDLKLRRRRLAEEVVVTAAPSCCRRSPRTSAA